MVRSPCPVLKEIPVTVCGMCCYHTYLLCRFNVPAQTVSYTAQTVSYKNCLLQQEFKGIECMIKYFRGWFFCSCDIQWSPVYQKNLTGEVSGVFA